MAELAVTFETTVTPDQIDHLGHMNVRFYGRNAQSATTEVLRRLGLDPTTATMRVDDIYTRHLHEQLVNAPLEVRSGVIDAADGRVRIYHELANQSDGAIAATFVHGVRTDTGDTADVIAAGRTQLTTIPPHGASRTISLDADPFATAPSIDVVRERGLAMRKPRAIGADECRADGTYIAEYAPMLTWAGEALDGHRGDELVDGPNGERMGWASMETRMTLVRLPRLGDQIQAFGALIEMRDKTMHRVQWAYDLATDELLTMFESVSLAFDTVGRRAMSIPERIRAREATAAHPDLTPSPVA